MPENPGFGDLDPMGLIRDPMPETSSGEVEPTNLPNVPHPISCLPGLTELAAVVPIGAIPGTTFSTIGQVMDVLGLVANGYDLVNGFISDLKKLGAGKAVEKGLKGLISNGIGYVAGTMGNTVDDILEAAGAVGGPKGFLIGATSGISLSVGFSSIQAAANETSNIASGYSRTYKTTGNKFLDTIGSYLPATANRLANDCGTDLFN